MATTQLAKWGNSLALRIPKALAEEAQLRPGEPVSLTIAGGEGGLLIKPSRRRYSLRQLVSRITPGNRHGEDDWGKLRGKEVW